MKICRVDIETFSSIDLKKSGVYRYAEAPDFEVMLFGYRFVENGEALGPRHVVDLTPLRAVQFQARRLAAAGKDIGPYLRKLLPPDVCEAIDDPAVVFSAFNAQFERVCLRAGLGLDISPDRWRCTMVHALTCGLPGDLARVGRVMHAAAQKDTDGRALIKLFTMPQKPTKRNNHQTRIWPTDRPEDWARFIEYNGDDVDAEHEIAQRLQAKAPMLEKEWRLYALDQHVNDKGVPIDVALVKKAIEIDTASKKRLTQRAIALTGISNPNSVKQLAEWLNKESEDDTWAEVTKINKQTMPALLKQFKGTIGEELLNLRIELGKASVKKYNAMDRSVCADGRVRGMLQFYGANRTGRWAGRLVQVHNMVSNKLKDDRKPDDPDYIDLLNVARELVLHGDDEVIETLFGSTPYILSQLQRTAFIAPKGMTFAPIDFAQIEARGLAWKAKVRWRLDVFERGEDIYSASAAQMFHIPLAVAREKENRQRGKVSELALGYQGGVDALVRMGALDMGLKMSELDPIKVAWREASPTIKLLWYAFQNAALRCVRTGRPQRVESDEADFAGGTRFRIHAGCLLMQLESGRELFYVKPKIEEGEYGDQVTFEGLNQMTKQWERTYSYGGKWVENWDQAFCRDILGEKLLRIEEEGLRPYLDFHVHDEAVPEIPIGSNLLGKFEKIFAEPVKWCPGMPLRGDGFLTPFYRKE